MLLQATQITKQLGHRMVLRGVDLSVDRGESVAVFGPNGAGKTTFINILATLMRPTSGMITINGEDIKNNPFSFRGRIGLVAHELNAYRELTPYENLTFFGQLYGIKHLKERIDYLLNYVGLAPFAHEQVRIFSSGMAKRFMITRALIHEPDILLFDEAFTGLDAAAKRFMITLMHTEQAKGKSIIFTTHDIQLGYEAASRFTFLFNGRIETVATRDEITLTDLQQRYENRLNE